MSDPASLLCPQCGDHQLQWKLHRLRTRNRTLTLKTIHWVCRRCGHSWLVPTAPAPLEGAPDGVVEELG